jgi:cytochrome c peroxidase
MILINRSSLIVLGVLSILMVSMQNCQKFSAHEASDIAQKENPLNGRGLAGLDGAVSVEDNIKLSAFPKVCEIKSGMSTCSTMISWDVGENDYLNPVCLFVAIVGSSDPKKLVSCARQGSINVDWITLKGNQFYLTFGSQDFSKATQIQELLVLGVNKNTSISGIDFEQNLDKRRLGHPVQASAFSTSSWDGKLIFGSIGLVNSKIGMTVRVLRSSRLEGTPSGNLDFSAPGLFSKVYLIDTDSLSSDEVTELLGQSRISSLGNVAVLGQNKANLNHSFHLAVFPHGSVVSNPYRSDKSGSPNPESGIYSTYRLYGIVPTNKVGSIESPYLVNSSSSARKHFLTRVEMQIVVKNSDTVDADIESVKLFNAALPLRDVNGNLLHGYEPSVTLDGRLIVYSSNYKPEMNEGNGGTVGYSFIQNQHLNSGWSIPENLARMYYKHGPGSATETMIGGHKFSTVFPVAKKPISEFDGERFTETDIIIGSYPWLSFKGSEVLFTSKSGFHGAARHGTTIVGERTQWILRRIDGQMEAVRGNVTDRFDVWDDAKSETLFGAGVKIAALYSEMVNPNTGVAFGLNGWMSILNIPVGQFPSSWNSVSTLNHSPLPLNSFRESYGFFMAGARYAEVHFPNLRDDLLLYFPMNEALKYNRALVNSKILDKKKPNPEVFRATGLSYVTNRVPDYSGSFQSGTLNDSARFPFEFYQAKEVWSTTKKVADRSEGIYGNSVVLTKSGVITTKLLPENINKIKDRQSFSFSAWFKKSADGPLPLVNIQSLFTVWLNSKTIDGRLYTSFDKVEGNRFVHVIPFMNNNEWFHLSVVYGHGRLRLYMNSVLILDQRFKGQILKDVDSNKVQMLLGPKNNSTVLGGQVLWIDEVYLYGIELPEQEILALGFYKEKKHEASLSAGVIELGRNLFNSSLLSVNNTVSCASCHSPALSFADPRGTSIGVTGKVLGRQSPSLLNLEKSKQFFWDGRAPSLKSQVLHPIYDRNEMGIHDVIKFYVDINTTFGSQFISVYGKKPDNDLIADALANYVSSLKFKGSSPLLQELSGNEEKGRRLFIGKANCVACHRGNELSDFEFHDVGFTERSSVDKGYGQFFLSQTLRNGMKTPTLINVSRTAPYYHDGRFETLDAVVRFYNKGGDAQEDDNRNMSSLIKPLYLREEEIGFLIEYLKSLDRDYSR